MQNNEKRNTPTSEQALDESYDQEFFNHLRDGSRQSAAVIVPLILNWINPNSVVDLGCGDGTWLSIFQAYGLDDIVGVDGSYVKPEMLQIPADHFMPWDLQQQVFLNRTFDLAVSLEVAEHLPKSIAQGFVESLIRLSNVVLFSAAIPYQGGTNHINEQWPDYWIALFAAQGYIAIDALRERIWDHPGVQPWYAQNSFLFVQGNHLSDYPALPKKLIQTHGSGQALVHPTIYLQHCPTSLPELQDKRIEPELTQIIQILGINLHPSAEIQSGEALTIKIDYQITSFVEAATFTLSISNAAEMILLDTEIVLTPLPDDYTIPHYIQLQIDRLDLIQGTYFINPGIFSLDWTQTHDFHWHRYPLSIRASVLQKGLVHPPMHWHKLINE
ncbi:MAG: methyltransferase domain-containing protein [Cyanothece sp. SIO1E1]|nr:methyltransferase domain-containing protein [Cyanothece sp. SIO1E1]